MAKQQTLQNGPFFAHISQDKTRAQTLKEHLEQTAQLAADFAQAFGGQDQARLAGLLHDIGKYSDAFQKRLWGGKPVDHSTAGAQVAFHLGHPEVSFAVAGHHSGLPDGGGKNDPPDAATFFGRQKRQAEPCEEWKQEMILPQVFRKALPADGFTAAFYTRMLYSCLVDADYLDTEAFMKGKKRVKCSSITPAELLKRLQNYVAPWWNAKTQLDQKRCEILRTCLEQGAARLPGIFTLTVPTGGGKTVSSLAFALTHAVTHKKRRVIYVIPYTSIIDQTADVFARILGKENVLEDHSGRDAVLAEKTENSAAYGKALATENWDAPVIVTTAVQFFESLFSNRPSRCRKLHNLAESVIIFDEAQTLPVSYLRPCVAAIGQLVRYYGVSAVLCTATQPALGGLFAELAPELTLREIIQNPQQLYEFFRRTTLRNVGELTKEELAKALCTEHQSLCVVNRRAAAKQLYEALPAKGRYCLTTLLCPADRKRLLKEIRARLEDNLPCHVVSTSLIEAGVDVDFPVVWREEAGLDSVVQAAGRCNREGKQSAENSVVSVFQLAGEPVPELIRPNVEAARSVWKRFRDPAQLQAIQEYFLLLRSVKGVDALDQKRILDGFANTMDGRILPFATVADRFKLIEAAKETVYIPHPEAKNLFEQLQSGHAGRKTYRRLGQYAVAVYPDHLAILQAAGDICSPDGENWVLADPAWYDSHTGLCIDTKTGTGRTV